MTQQQHMEDGDADSGASCLSENQIKILAEISLLLFLVNLLVALDWITLRP